MINVLSTPSTERDLRCHDAARNNDGMGFYTRVMARAEELGVSDADLARICGVSRTLVYSWKKRGAIPNKYARPLAGALATPVTYLLYGEGEKPTVKKLGQVDQHTMAGVLAAMFELFDCHNAPEADKAAQVAALLYDDAVLGTGEIDETKLKALMSLLK